MAQYFLAEDAEWIRHDVRGTVMDKRVLWEGGFDIRSAIYRMPSGMVTQEHRHDEWVQVLVIEGEMKVEPVGKDAVRVRAGGLYVLEPGDAHTETAAEDSLLLITQLDDHPSYIREAKPLVELGL
ncbi:cupin domain-containing protein [Microbacterium sp. F51-2R]|uniref:cupin domain-containing protein n=1 Tax=Microbacterium sp. F51-2R TaxID=3445777 RepID=UPI003F9EC4E5